MSFVVGWEGISLSSPPLPLSLSLSLSLSPLLLIFLKLFSHLCWCASVQLGVESTFTMMQKHLVQLVYS